MKKFTTLKEDIIKENALAEQSFNTRYEEIISSLSE